jgi:hypothetical protein
MYRVATGVAIGIPAGAALICWTIVRDLTTGHEEPILESRTVPQQRRPWREEFATLPLQAGSRT